MGDNAENALPPSKKRAAGRELSRDNPGLDDEEEVPGEETGTFKRAPEEVLANRRIVKVRRSQQSHSQPSSTPSSNPFAAIRLVPPTPTPTPPPVTVQETEKTEVESVSPSSVNKKTDKEEGENDKSTPENNVDEKTEVVEKKADEEKKEEENVTEKGDDSNKEINENAPEAEKGDNDNKEKEENAPEAEIEKKENSSVSSFQQLSSSQNAFTGLVGTGFSTSSFSFGSINPKTDDNNNNSTATPFPSFSFATNGNLNSTTSLFPENKTEKIPTMQEVHVETGEENENAVFTADSALFEFLDGGWKERGKGELKVNVLTTGTKKARLVMRARGNYRLILNASIYPDMKLTNMEKKGITFACFNSTGEGKEGLSTFALKFKDSSIVEEFRSIVTEYKGNANANATDGSTTATTSSKTPENSPKASDE